MDSAAATKAIAEFAATLGYADIPSATVSTVKRVILDCVGTALAATTLGEGCREAIAVARAQGGTAESTILGVGARVPAVHAAFANGALIHALNYDPIGAEIGHVGVAGVAAPLALAEATGLTGRDLIAAVTVACEVSARVTAAISRTGRRPSEKFLSGQLLSHFGTAAGAGRALGLDAAGLESTLGLVLMQMSGSRQVVLSGDPPAKAIYGAFPSQAGVLAALLAREGLGARYDVFGEPAGLYAAIYGGTFDAEALSGDLGRTFLLDAVEFKPWPTSNQVHAFVEAALEIATNVRAADIASIEVSCHSRFRPWCEPSAKRRLPENPTAAADSIPFCVAAALAHGEIALQAFTLDGIRDPASLDLAARVSMRFDEAVKGAAVSVKTKAGEWVDASVESPLGSRSRPISDVRLLEKFRDCGRRSIVPLTDDRIERVIAMIHDLESLEDVGKLARAACGQ
ncbi:MAG TPA: MmgE/PrpD family protein [Alphaproteobacteria bacterium]|nr:MmgE/PrpD family protein [Alphaproteobacteria bacterium]